MVLELDVGKVEWVIAVVREVVMTVDALVGMTGPGTSGRTFSSHSISVVSKKKESPSSPFQIQPSWR